MAAGFKNGLRKVGTKWHYKFKINGETYHGSTHCIYFADAVAWLQAYRGQVARQRVGAADPPTFLELYRLYVRAKQNKASAGYLSALENNAQKWMIPLIGKIRIDRLQLWDIDEIGNHYMATPSNTGVMHNLGGLRSLMINLRTILLYAIKQKILRELPFTIEVPKVQQKQIQAIPGHFVPRFLEAVDRLAAKKPDVVLAIRTMLYLGLRISEVTGMRWEWFSSDWTTYTPGKTKGKEAVALPMNPDLAARFQSHKQRQQVASDCLGIAQPPWVFCWPDGNPRSTAFASGILEKAAKAAGLTGSWSPHKLRASYATILSEAGASAFVIQQLLRHKHISTTLRYAKTTEDMMREAQQKMLQRIEDAEGHSERR
jgi:integrase/recombinase XerC